MCGYISSSISAGYWKIPVVHGVIARTLFTVFVASALMMQVAGCSSGSGDADGQVIAFQQVHIIDAVRGTFRGIREGQEGIGGTGYGSDEIQILGTSPVYSP